MGSEKVKVGIMRLPCGAMVLSRARITVEGPPSTHPRLRRELWTRRLRLEEIPAFWNSCSRSCWVTCMA